jgi:hypothetical protein
MTSFSFLADAEECPKLSSENPLYCFRHYLSLPSPLGGSAVLKIIHPGYETVTLMHIPQQSYDSKHLDKSLSATTGRKRQAFLEAAKEPFNFF